MAHSTKISEEVYEIFLPNNQPFFIEKTSDKENIERLKDNGQFIPHPTTRKADNG